MDATTVSRFQALLTGNTRVFGTYNNIQTERGDGKLTGTPVTLFTGVTTTLYADHLAGKNGLGIAPIADDNTCVFGAIDIDVYADLDHAILAQGLHELGLPLVPCRSKSGGCHIYAFASTPIAASLMQGKLREVAALIGHGKAEVFPKQIVISNPKAGAGWINLPYFSGDEGTRYALSPSGEQMTLAQFLDHAERIKVGAGWFQQAAAEGGRGKDKDPLPDGPPCFNTLIQIKFPVGTQDDGMFNLGIYARKAHPSNWAQFLQDANTRYFNPPIGADDLRRIIGSVGKTEYKYACQKSPLVQHCNSQVCRRRKYGVGDGSEVAVFGQLRKLLTTPPVWYWEIEIGGRSGNDSQGTLELTTGELQDPAAVQRKLMEQLNFAPSMPKRTDWTQTLQTAMKGVISMDPLPEDASIEGQFWELVEQFCSGQVQAFSYDEILMGKPYRAPEGRTYFRLADLMKFLARQGFKEYKVNAAAKVLRSKQESLQVQHGGKALKGNKFTNLWSLRSFEQQTEGHPIPETIKNDEPVY